MQWLLIGQIRFKGNHYKISKSVRGERFAERILSNHTDQILRIKNVWIRHVAFAPAHHERFLNAFLVVGFLTLYSSIVIETC